MSQYIVIALVGGTIGGVFGYWLTSPLSYVLGAVCGGTLGFITSMYVR